MAARLIALGLADEVVPDHRGKAAWAAGLPALGEEARAALRDPAAIDH